MSQTISTLELIKSLHSLNIQLSVDGERLQCNAPKGALTDALKAQISEQKADIIMFLNNVNSHESSKIELVSRDGKLPLSYTQKRLWLLDKIEPESTAYNMSKAVRLRGELNLTALEKSLNEIFNRHEVLRTTFSETNNHPQQMIAPANTLTLTITDLQDVAERDAKAKELVSQERNHVFDLQQGPLVRVRLLLLAADDHILIVNAHHIIFDGWSFNLFYRELSELYKAFRQGQTSPLKPLPIQYADFAHWQQQQANSKAFQTQLDYWVKHLEGAPHVLELPIDYPRPAIQGHSGALISQYLPKALLVKLKQLSQQEDATLFMTLLAGFKILCYQLTQQERITIGSPIAGRNRAEVESLMGFFVTNLLLHTDLSGNPSCRELLQRVRQVALEGYENQDVPFERLLEALKPERDQSRTPLFQVWFNMFNLNGQEFELCDLTIEQFFTDITSSKFDLTLYIQETEQGIFIRWVYNKDLFKANTVEYMGQCFQTLLENMVAQPNQGITTLPLLNQQSRPAAPPDPITLPFTEFSKSEIEQSIPARFAAQVNQRGEQIAVKTQRYQWTYQDLEQHSNQVAQTLLTQENTTRAALLFEHDAPMIAGLLGTLKAGKAYVPLDPTYPVERLRYVLENSQATVILTNAQNLKLARQLASETVMLINIEDLSTTPKTAPEVEILPGEIAYILYTSGSTGQPKGVIQNHRNILHFIRNQTNRLHISSQDRVLLLASYSFDAAVVDIFSAILNGATLYPFDIKNQGFNHLAQWLNEQHITLYHSTPTLYRSFLEQQLAESEELSAKLSTIRAIILGGEPSLPADLERYQRWFSPDCVFVNLFGSTESTISLEHIVTQNTDPHRRMVTVGYPLDDTDVLLLNEAGVETEVYGEIAIRSPHLALGYWQKPDLSQKVFLPDPEGGERRIYKTGDLGRLRADGTLEVLGRQDFQIKLRGIRIELGEIETTLARHPQVQKAVVTSFTDESGDNRLAAYIVPRSALQTEQVDSQALRHFLQKQLPDAMVPSVFLQLNSLPLTPNGKVDRRSLPAPDPTQHAVNTTFVAPRTPIEKQVSQIWCQLLKLEKVGIYDNFFEIGGHSLLAVQAAASIEQALEQPCTVMDFFQYSTVQQLAEQLQSNNTEPSRHPSLFPINTAPTAVAPLFCIHVLGPNLSFYRPLAEHLKQYNLYGLASALSGDPQAPHPRDIKNLATYYIQAIKTVQPVGPYNLIGVSFGGHVAFEIAQQLIAQGETIHLMGLLDAYCPVKSNSYMLQRLGRHLQIARKKGFGYLLPRLKSIKTGFHHQRFKSKQSKRRLHLDEANVQARSYLKPEEHREVNRNYKFVPYPGEVTLFRAQYDADVKLGWLALAGGGLTIHDIPGDHLGILTEPHVQEVARYLRDILDSVLLAESQT